MERNSELPSGLTEISGLTEKSRTMRYYLYSPPQFAACEFHYHAARHEGMVERPLPQVFECWPDFDAPFHRPCVLCFWNLDLAPLTLDPSSDIADFSCDVAFMSLLSHFLFPSLSFVYPGHPTNGMDELQ